MRVFKHVAEAVACAASVALASLMLILCGAWLWNSASLVQSLALIAMSVLGSGVVALMEFRSSSTVRCRTDRNAPLAASSFDLQGHITKVPIFDVGKHHHSRRENRILY